MQYASSNKDPSRAKQPACFVVLATVRPLEARSAKNQCVCQEEPGLCSFGFRGIVAGHSGEFRQAAIPQWTHVAARKCPDYVLLVFAGLSLVTRVISERRQCDRQDGGSKQTVPQRKSAPRHSQTAPLIKQLCPQQCHATGEQFFLRTHQLSVNHCGACETQGAPWQQCSDNGTVQDATIHRPSSRAQKSEKQTEKSTKLSSATEKHGVSMTRI